MWALTNLTRIEAPFIYSYLCAYFNFCSGATGRSQNLHCDVLSGINKRVFIKAFEHQELESSPMKVHAFVDRLSGPSHRYARVQYSPPPNIPSVQADSRYPHTCRHLFQPLQQNRIIFPRVMPHQWTSPPLRGVRKITNASPLKMFHMPGDCKGVSSTASVQ